MERLAAFAGAKGMSARPDDGSHVDDDQGHPGRAWTSWGTVAMAMAAMARVIGV